MCGICGIINLDGKPVDQDSIIKMMSKIKHRGPDDEGYYLKGNIGMGFVRLSILDLSMNGHQPMFDISGRYLIIHNGEIFNYKDIILKYSFPKKKVDSEIKLLAKLFELKGVNFKFK